MKNKLIHFFGSTSVIAMVPVAVLAASGAPTGAPTTLDAIYTAVCTVANWFFAFVLVIAVAAMVYAGFLFLTSQGGEKVQTAKKAFWWGLIGAAVAILSKTLVIVIGDVLGVDVSGFFSCGGGGGGGGGPLVPN